MNYHPKETRRNGKVADWDVASALITGGILSMRDLIDRYRETGRTITNRYQGQTLHVRPVGKLYFVHKETPEGEVAVAQLPDLEDAMDWGHAHGAALMWSHVK